MIDNPLPDQVMQEKETLQKAQDFKFYCRHHAKEIAEHYKVHEDLHEYFAEWYHDYMNRILIYSITLLSILILIT